ncbi:MAG: hypothetical protein ACOWWO_14280 [Peptococcaceae bacterium]
MLGAVRGKEARCKSISLKLIKNLFNRFPHSPRKANLFTIPLTAGSGGDVHTRKLGTIAKKYLGQPIIFENKPGGGIATGTITFKQPADGYAIVEASPSIINLMIEDNPPFKKEDIQPIIIFYG